MRKTPGAKKWAVVLLIVFWAGLGMLSAHHSFSMFDTGKRVTLTGSVTMFEWTNPHAYIEVDVPQEGGGVKHWSVEMGSPSILMQGGWKFKDVKAGDKVTVVLNPLRNGDPGGLLVQVTLPDGRVLGNGPGRGPAAPAAGGASATAPAGRGQAAPATGGAPATAPAGR